jgi:hypothetical protein
MTWYSLQGAAQPKNCRCSSGKPEFVEDALHGDIYGVVMAVQGDLAVNRVVEAIEASGTAKQFRWCFPCYAD